jgi:hypothetical protein
MLEGYPFQDIGHVFTSVGGTLHVIIDFTPLDDVGDVGRVFEKFRESSSIDHVGHVLQSVYLDAPF